MVKRGAAEVDEAHRGVVDPPLAALLRGDEDGDIFNQEWRRAVSAARAARRIVNEALFLPQTSSESLSD